MQSKITFETDTFLKKTDLKIGNVYMYKDGRLVVYFGKDNWGRFIFYALANVLYEKTDNYRVLTISHYDTQVKYLINMAEEIMHKAVSPNQVIALKGMPQLYCEFPYIQYDKELANWWTKNKMLSKESLPDLVELIQSPNKKSKDSLYVSAKDLVPGELYYTGALWRSLFLYLGRDSSKRFCWYFVGNEDYLMRNDINEYLFNIDRTKTNKRCKRLADAVNDPDAYISSDVKKLIDMNWHANLAMLNLG